jgi:hypothetical protein
MEERRVETQQIEVGGIKINIPKELGGLPTKRSIEIMEAFQDERGWKYGVGQYRTHDRQIASELADCLDHYHGGHEWEETEDREGTSYGVSSRGYYHYIGA